ncbi:MAG TPA: hypothetical protein VM935_02410 [Chitinophagaceae bacterium]|nr:hypothetical protein [Chitinophagaceae bacterium]
MKRILIIVCLVSATTISMAQDKRERKEAKREEKRQRTNAIIKQEEEGVLAYEKQTSAGVQLRTNGFGAFLELGRMKSPRFTNLYLLEVSEIFHPKEEKVSSLDQNYFGSSFKYAKVNNFFQVKFGMGQQYIFGNKGNKNGIAVLGIYQGGLSLGLLKPYYVNVDDGSNQRVIKYSDKDSVAFVTYPYAAGGLGKGWGEVKINPGIFAKTALRFDFGSYNESITALEIGMSIDAYAKKAEQLVYSDPRRLFFQGHIAIVFGNRR